MGHLRLEGHFPLGQAAVKTCLRANGKQIRAALRRERQNICNGIAQVRITGQSGAKNMVSRMPQKRQIQGRLHEELLMDFQLLKPLKGQCCSAKFHS
jgi:hypothetical protein